MTKKKVGIVTLHGYFNYGNRLQNYALKYILKHLECDVETSVIIDSISSKDENIWIKRIKNIFGLNLKELIQLFRIMANKEKRQVFLNSKSIERERTAYFRKFSKENLNEHFYYLDDNESIDKLNTIDYFVTGSDQVWNPYYYEDLDKYFLTFAPENKRIAYSPSISVDKLPQQYITDYKEWLEGMASISVREKTGANIIKNLIGKEVPVLADPTMLLNKEQWLEISKKAPNRPKTPYLLTYFLGGPSESTRKKLEKIARKNNMKIINLGDIKEEETYLTGPQEFLDYINNASAFFTDSFHGVVFSIIFQTPFIVYKRLSSLPSMYSRIETILDKFNYRERENDGFNGDIFSMDFSTSDKVLKIEYDKSIEYIKESLDIKNK